VLIHLRKLASLLRDRQIIIGMLCIMASYNLFYLLLLIYQVAPVQFSWSGWDNQTEWSPGVDPGVMAQLSYGLAGIETGTDWGMVLITPIIYWKVEMENTKKQWLKILLLMGVGWVFGSLVKIC
jgi:hypothetical protein